MDVRVKRPLARVGMHHRDGTGGALQLLVVVAEGAHRLPRTPHQQFVEDIRVRPAERPEFGGQGEGQQKVLGGHLLFHLTFQPLLTLRVLTVRAVAMAAGVWHPFLLFAAGAFDLPHRAGRRATPFHRRECSIVVSGESVAVMRQEICLEGFDDGSEPDHLTFPQGISKPSIRPLIRSMA